MGPETVVGPSWYEAHPEEVEPTAEALSRNPAGLAAMAVLGHPQMVPTANPPV